MAELWNDVTAKLGNLAAKWTAYAALGSFILYLFGYLTLRFQLSTYGVATNLDIFDEKYLFAGCRFLVFLAATVPSILILLLVVWAVAYFPWKFVPASFKDRLQRRVSDWCAVPSHLPLLGVALAVLFIQLVLRRCFVLGNLLLRRQLPDEWISSVLLSGDAKLALYFTGLVAGTALTAAILVCVLQRRTATTNASRIWLGLLGFLLAVEFLLLPVNYGVLIATQQLPRVAEVAADQKPAEGESAWLVADSKEMSTYFTRDRTDQRMLVSIPKKDSKIKIVAYDDIFCVLFGAGQAGTGRCPG